MDREIVSAVELIRDSFGINGMKDAIALLQRELAAAEAAYESLREATS
jgi:hypothetical protein